MEALMLKLILLLSCLSFTSLTCPLTVLAACADPPLPVSGLTWPAEGDVTRGWTLDCISDSGHRGIDIATTPGANIVAASSGTISFAGYTPAEGGGLTISVSHPGGFRSTYLHLESISVEPGQFVDEGQALGVAGDYSVHFGLKMDDGHDAYYDPSDYLIPRVVVKAEPDVVDPVITPAQPTPVSTVPPVDIEGADVSTPDTQLQQTPGPRTAAPVHVPDHTSSVSRVPVPPSATPSPLLAPGSRPPAEDLASLGANQPVLQQHRPLTPALAGSVKTSYSSPGKSGLAGGQGGLTGITAHDGTSASMNRKESPGGNTVTGFSGVIFAVLLIVLATLTGRMFSGKAPPADAVHV
jgi:hypothetical protein